MICCKYGDLPEEEELDLDCCHLMTQLGFAWRSVNQSTAQIVASQAISFIDFSNIGSTVQPSKAMYMGTTTVLILKSIPVIGSMQDINIIYLDKVHYAVAEFSFTALLRLELEW